MAVSNLPSFLLSIVLTQVNIKVHLKRPVPVVKATALHLLQKVLPYADSINIPVCQHSLQLTSESPTVERDGVGKDTFWDW